MASGNAKAELASLGYLIEGVEPWTILSCASGSIES
jgi:hypothetical protein